ncbi:MAG: PfkB family carbohydrate kinase [Gemmatimonadota bacterium]
MDGSYSFLCFGEALWDAWPDRRAPGGAPMNVALGLTRLGADVRLLSRVGADASGRELLAYIAAQGLDIGSIQVDPSVPTGTVRVDASDPIDVTYEICSPAAWDFIGFLPQESRSDADVVICGSLAARHEVSRQTLLQLLGAAALGVVDVNLRPPFVDRQVIGSLLERADCVKVNEAELALLCSWEGIRVAPDDLRSAVDAWARRRGFAAVAVTRGARGACCWSGGRWSQHPGYRVEVLDTIGCGDAFLARWLWETSRGSEPDVALARACAVGALVATREGATPVVAEEEVRALVDRPD